jgi:uncharacterized phage-associated protein
LSSFRSSNSRWALPSLYKILVVYFLTFFISRFYLLFQTSSEMNAVWHLYLHFDNTLFRNISSVEKSWINFRSETFRSRSIFSLWSHASNSDQQGLCFPARWLYPAQPEKYLFLRGKEILTVPLNCSLAEQSVCWSLWSAAALWMISGSHWYSSAVYQHVNTGHPHPCSPSPLQGRSRRQQPRLCVTFPTRPSTQPTLVFIPGWPSAIDPVTRAGTCDVTPAAKAEQAWKAGYILAQISRGKKQLGGHSVLNMLYKQAYYKDKSYPEDRSDTFLRNVGNHLQVFSVSQPTRPQLESSQPWRPQISEGVFHSPGKKDNVAGTKSCAVL